MKVTKAEVFFSTRQSKDGFVTNTKRNLFFKKTLLKILSGIGIEGATLTKNTGIWQGKTEPSFGLIIYNTESNNIETLGQALKKSFNQDSVLIVLDNKPVFV